MMNQMRSNMPLIMWILVACFLGTIVFSWGMGGFTNKNKLSGVIGNVGDHEILYDRYNRSVQDKIAQERTKNPNTEVTDAQIKQARKDVWDDMVRTELMKVYEERLGIETTDAEVAYAVKNNPPDFIRTNQNFQNNGNFDRSKYEEFLRDPRSAQTLVAIESDYRTSMNGQKVIDRLIAPVFVSAPEVYDEFIATSRRFKASAVSFPLRNYPIDTTSISKQEIEKYFDENKMDYQRKERRKLSYVTVPLLATNDDTTRIYEIAQEAKDRALKGDDFAALVKEYSEDQGSAAQGGDLGYFAQGRMVKEFDSTAFNTDPGKIVGPVSTRFGLHIIKVVDRKSGAEGDSVRASHILVKWKLSSDTEERSVQKAKDLIEAAKTDGFVQAAARSSLEIKDTDYFTQASTGNVPGFGALLPAMDFAFGGKLGEVTTYPLKTKSRGGDGYTVFAIKDIQPAGLTPLSEVESSIRATLVKKKQEAKALEAAQVFRKKVNSFDSFMNEAVRESLKVDTTGEHLQRDYLQVFGSDENIAKKLLAMNIGQISEPLSNARGAYVAILTNKASSDTTGFSAKSKDLLEQLRRTKQNRVYSDWLESAKKEITVVDSRYLYYNDY